LSKLVALAGIGDEAAPAPLAPRTMLIWGLILGTTVGIFVGTLLLNPSRKRRS
jgi:hypothetical protein